MSKAPTGFFSATKGDNAFYGTVEALIAYRVKGLDLREHPLNYKQLSSKAHKRIKSKIDARTATKNEYKRFMWDRRFTRRRKDAIDKLWKEEKRRISKGLQGTRNWSSEQQLSILQGKKPKFKGRTMHGHHTYSVAKYPHLANRPEVIYPATPYEHLHAWHGGNYRNNKPGERINKINEF